MHVSSKPWPRCSPVPEVTPRKLRRLVVVGLGLIGGSFAKGLREKGLFEEVVGVDRDPQTRRLAVQLGVVDRCEESLREGCRDADVIQLAVPILAMEKVLAELATFDLGHAVLTDVGSAKGNVVRAARVAFGEMPARFVPGHPIAGSEQSGVEAANGKLFRRHKVILTPLDNADADAVQCVEALWRELGADVELMEVEHHDEVLAATSHLPHLLAFTLVDSLAKRSENLEIFRYAAGGFRDFTRIAGSDPTMWHDIFLANRKAVLRILDVFRDDLDALREAVDAGDGQQLMGVFTRARVAREHFSKILARRAYVDAMHNNDLIYLAQPGGRLSGRVRVPGDKSISHRSIMLGSLAEGTTEVEGFLEGEDALATIQAFRDMGVVIEGPHHGRVTVHGVGLHGLKPAPGPIYLGNSGTSMRLLSGLLAAQPFDSTLTGDASLTKRPMNRVAKPLREMGAVIETAAEGRPPLTIKGGQKLTGMHYDMPMASAQVKSCLLLAGLYAAGETSVTEPAPTRDHTERMLRGFGYPVDVEGSTAKVESGHKLSATNIEVPADISSAAFFLVAASIAEGSEIVLEHVGINPTRTGVIDILKLMGADITLENQREVGGEPVADLRVRSARLKGIDIPEDLVPLAIDEFPVLFVAAASASGRTVLRGAEELRVKESDRIQVMADGLLALGVKCEPTPDGIIIDGGPYGGGEVWSHGDHRIAMSFSVASLRASAPIRIHDCANVATSFPNFLGLAAGAGIRVAEEGN
ncbi:bifunctional prephenate dehydrogenase/3-phosphoshikimate 1-carboxyvinyltransferase [Pseudomonas citronellolis]|nr:bifunctional prephenate dehydrogenase/3-phosphoshikimate 1-carboxyvinyltransferase [Pseudomonas citronellolis]